MSLNVCSQGPDGPSTHLRILKKSPIFLSNHATLDSATGVGSAGAIKFNYSGGATSVLIENTIFAQNKADQEGGAIFVGSSLSTDFKFTMRDVTLWNNESGLVADPEKNETGGGALLLSLGDGTATFERLTVAQNWARNHETSGAFYLPNPKAVTLKDTIFYQNCQEKNFPGVEELVSCSNLTHIGLEPGQELSAAGPVYEWPANQDYFSKALVPVSSNAIVEDVKFVAPEDVGAFPVKHPCSAVDSGSGGKC